MLVACWLTVCCWVCECCVRDVCGVIGVRAMCVVLSGKCFVLVDGWLVVL